MAFSLSANTALSQHGRKKLDESRGPTGNFSRKTHGIFFRIPGDSYINYHYHYHPGHRRQPEKKGLHQETKNSLAAN